MTLPDRSMLEATATDVGLGDIASELAALARPALRARPQDSASEIGMSRIGGQPDLPAHVPWPRDGQDPFVFLGQIELSALDPKIWIGPRHGLLSLFGLVERMSVEKPCVLHHPSSADLERRTAPVGAEHELCLPETHIASFAPELMLPVHAAGEDSHALLALGISRDGPRADSYHRLLAKLRLGWVAEDPLPVLLGWPQGIQSEILTGFAYAGMGRQGDYAAAIATHAEWSLLVQLADVDGAMHYFGLPTEDLRAGRWERTQSRTESD